jgi:hypothetical protein
MRRTWKRRIAIPLVALGFAGCSDGNDPDPGPTDFLDLSLDFCSGPGQSPVFLAYQNQGENWTRVNPSAGNTFDFRASDKVALAMIFQDGGTYSTEIVYAQNDELLPLSGGACTEVSGTKTVNGSVTNIPAGSFANLTMGLGSAFFEPPPSTYTLSDLANGPLDLLATRGMITGGAEVPDRVIIRRALNPTNGATLAALDFAAAEAANVTANTLTVSGISANEDNLIDLFFSTATTLDHALFLSDFFTSGTQTIYHVPSTLTQAGDLHLLDVYAQTGTGSALRGETQYYRTAANKSVALGAALNSPTLTTVSSTSPVRLRTQLAVQPEYNSFVVSLFSQGTARSVSVIGTAAYFGSPSTWDVAIPDLSGVTGFPSASGLQQGQATEWQVVGYGGTLATYFGATEENSSIKYAARFSSFNALMASRAGGGQARRQAPKLLGRRKLGVR